MLSCRPRFSPACIDLLIGLMSLLLTSHASAAATTASSLLATLIITSASTCNNHEWAYTQTITLYCPNARNMVGFKVYYCIRLPMVWWHIHNKRITTTQYQINANDENIAFDYPIVVKFEAQNTIIPIYIKIHSSHWQHWPNISISFGKYAIQNSNECLWFGQEIWVAGEWCTLFQ